MGTHEKREWLQWQLTETQRLLDTVQESRLMQISLNNRIEYIKDQLRELPENSVEAKVRLLFAGGAVAGSVGIKSSFASKTMNAMQELIRIESIMNRYDGEIGRRGRMKNIGEMYLTNLPHGSFGFELSLINDKDLFENEDVAQSIKSVMDIVEATSRNQTHFEQLVASHPQRMFSCLKDFFKQLVDEKSTLKMESGSKHLELNRIDAQAGYDRISSTIYNERTISIRGIFKGAFVNTGKFEFEDEECNIRHGKISEDIDTEQIVQYNQVYTNELCDMMILERTMTFNDGKEKRDYELNQIQKVAL